MSRAYDSDDGFEFAVPPPKRTSSRWAKEAALAEARDKDKPRKEPRVQK
jgi:hypothetical protein